MQSLDNISLIIFLPFWIFLVIMCGRFFSVYVNRNIINVITILSSGLGIFVCGYELRHFSETIEWTHQFLRIQDFSLFFGIHVDKMSLIFATVLLLISFAVQLFSASYMKEEKKYYRFFALLNLFNFGMLLLLFSPNLYQLYVFWELIGIVSYLLIGFDYKNLIKSDASKRVFIVNRIGDTALISGIILTTYVMLERVGSTALAELSISDFNSVSTLLMGYTSSAEFYIICGLFILSAMVKSAQFPFHIWLQDAMEAKIPVSALLHSATMVTAGIYLILRLMPFFTLNAYLMKTITIIGILTALICVILASIEIHPKKVLAYSTSANLGIMFMLLGLGNFKGAIVFLIAHAFIKSMLFLTLPKENGQLSYAEYILSVLASLSLAGVIFAGIPIKEILYLSIKFNPILLKLMLFFIFVSAFYIARLSLIIYKNTDLKREIKDLEFISSLILLVLNTGLCIILTKGRFYITVPYLTALLGIIFAFILFKFNLLEKLGKLPAKSLIYTSFSNFYNWFALVSNKIEKKIFANYKPLINSAKLCVKFVNFLEKNIMEKSVKSLAEGAKLISEKDMIMQSKNVQTYNAYAFILITAVAILVIVGYMIIVTYMRVY